MTDQVKLIIDGIEVKASKGEKLLWVALDNGIYIPNLCALRDMDLPFGACRLCFVEIEGRSAPVTACSEPVAEGMVVHTKTPEVHRLRRTAFELLLTHHPVDCSNCAKNRQCELQRIASRLKLKLKLRRFRPVPRSLPVDSSHPLFLYDPSKCVLCGKCVWVCNERGSGVFDFTNRGIDTMVSTFGGVPLIDSGCNSCLECVRVCPVGALVLKAGTGKEEVNGA
ncbi:2Fe-2S iron-sulfur cluster-binding protein [Chloroflexota bacterium]